ncbi:hypothetical protein SSX86_027608 [Deinandra increscens subsp. villosa]|uniref:TF-B3 domain-containing protein n=1 Tax=Deinandra increscens subsp. villosa TaxID=3103831 RepID=A0AAP0GIK7_9ASTR
MPGSFFMILFDPSADHLSLPPDYVDMHLKKKIPNSPITLSANGGYSWRLEIKKIGDSCCFTNGWSNVVKDLQLGFADFLYFQFVDEFTFILSVYGPNGCEKIFPQKIEDDGGENVVDHDEEEKKYDGNNDDDYDDAHDDDDDDDADDEENGDDEEDPCFVTIINKTHKKILRLPAGFEELVGIKAEGTMKLKNLDGKEWVTGLKLDKSYRASIRYHMSPGWCAFRKQNDLLEGDKCVFKYIRSERTLLLAKVTKKPRPPSSDGFWVVERARGRGS